MGVPRQDILIENRSTNTGENVLFTRQLLAERQLDPARFIVVQKPYMERRSYATFRKVWPEKDVLVTSPRVSLDEYLGKYSNEALTTDDVISIMVGDLQRIKLYPAKGFQIHQDIPDDVWAGVRRAGRDGLRLAAGLKLNLWRPALAGLSGSVRLQPDYRGSMTRTLIAVVLAPAGAPGRLRRPARAAATAAEHPADPGRRPGLWRFERVRAGAVPDARARSPGARRHAVHAVLCGQHGVCAVAGRPHDRDAHRPRVDPGKRRAPRRRHAAAAGGRDDRGSASRRRLPHRPHRQVGTRSARHHRSSPPGRASSTPSGPATSAMPTGSSPITCGATASGWPSISRRTTPTTSSRRKRRPSSSAPIPAPSSCT